MSPMPPSKSATTRKRLDVLLTASLTRLATMLGVTLTEERIQSYLEPLSELTEAQIERSFKRAAKEFKPKAWHQFPVPAEIIEFSQTNVRSGFIDDSSQYLALKPPDKTPMTAEEARTLLGKLKSEGKT